MEDALAQLQSFLAAETLMTSLNPCFNGRCTRTFLIALATGPYQLS